ncbi:hypothetical protein Misp01_62690 [Microtetraspora sp. NBRC 13810]|uniref:helix-turn-helix domain-containing protein n=1 Tax=Microtetraspora sp. NBRC 13810 TaxID=3030990 RepID=UPI0024A30386|nr:helix-turn-helix transcriptional regulator [Microtetraspora sp. NBRC 13810]GLW11141.1 hypothetical protein Misp01_62690 [Microtetraspora sp. NBRC 13810]
MPRRPEPVDPNASPWHLLGAALRYWRDDVRVISQREAAAAGLCDDSDLSKWERGLARPHPDTVARLDALYGAGGQLVALHASMADLDRLRTLASSGHRDLGESATDRRRLLQIAAAAGLGALGGTEAVRQLLNMGIGDDFRDLDEWELSSSDHLHALRTRPPAAVAAHLAIDLDTLRRQKEVSSPAELPALHRVTAELCAIHANVLTRLGEHGAAIGWWRTGRRAADASGDFEIRLLIRSEEAGHSLYGQRSPESVLRLVDAAERLAGEPLVHLLSTRAKALSMLGRTDEARQTLRTLLDVAHRGVPADSAGFYTPSQVYFTQSWVYAAAGDETAAGAAQEEVRRLTGDYVYRANVELHRALCLVRARGVAEGVRHAAGMLDTVPAEYLSNHVLETGRMVLRAVPVEQRGRADVAEFGEFLAVGRTGDASRGGRGSLDPGQGRR